MANLDETFRQYVQEETADKFLWGDGNGITILGGEADAVVVDANESAVGDADPVGISAEVVENLLWATEGSFAVNDPIDAVELVFQLPEARWVSEVGSVCAQLKLILVVSEPKGIEKLAAKKPRHGLDGKQKARVCGVPQLLRVVEPAPGDDAMQVWMGQELPGPGVQYGGEGKLSFEPALAELQ